MPDDRRYACFPPGPGKRNDPQTGIPNLPETGFKEAWKSIKAGDKWFEQGKGTFDLARDLYLFSHLYNPDHPGLNYKLGACYLFTDDKYQAIEYLDHAYRLNPGVSHDIHLLLAQAFQLVLEFDSAAIHYQAHRDMLEDVDRIGYDVQLERRLAECERGKELAKHPVRVIIQNLGEEINSGYDDYNPVFASGDSALFFTSRRPLEKSKRNEIDNKFNEDMYRSSHSGAGFLPAVRLGKPYNTEHNESLVGVSPDGGTLLIYRGNIEGGELQGSRFLPEKGKWKKPKTFSGKIGSKDGESSACLSPDGNTLYFVSKNRKLSRGGKDILVSKKNEKGRWSAPRNPGQTINTKLDEEGVFLSGDGNTLYFASQGHSSMGGFDIFKSTRDAGGNWSLPENLGYPINTPDDEVFYITDKEGIYGYYSANRDGGFGAKDIYKVIYLGAEKEVVLAMRDELVAGPEGRKTGFFTLPQRLVLDTSLVMRGAVIDSTDGRKPVVAKLTIIDPESGNTVSTSITDPDGAFSLHLPDAGVYGVEINAPGYLYYLDILDLIGESPDEEQYREFHLQPFEVGTKVVMENIYFETGKAVLRPESYGALNQVVTFTENNPGMKLEISGHTDNTGSLRINQKLSRDRAKAVVDYLVAQGIGESMLVYEGYADSQPVAPNDTPEGRERNRRVEFKVLSK
ncbi:MAG: OmpA family protein [Bacteroidales bacterium]